MGRSSSPVSPRTVKLPHRAATKITPVRRTPCLVISLSLVRIDSPGLSERLFYKCSGHLSRRESPESLARQAVDWAWVSRPACPANRGVRRLLPSTQDRFSQALHHAKPLTSFLAKGHQPPSFAIRKGGDRDEDLVHPILQGKISESLAPAQNRKAVDPLSGLSRVVINEADGLVREVGVVSYLPQNHFAGVACTKDDEPVTSSRQPGKILPEETEKHPAPGHENQEEKGIEDEDHSRIAVEASKRHESEDRENGARED